MNYITTFWEMDPSLRSDLYGFPVEVLHGDETSHFEALMSRVVYESLDPESIKTFSKVEKDLSKQKWLKDVSGELMPRHVFGPPGNLGDPDLEEVE